MIPEFRKRPRCGGMDEKEIHRKRKRKGSRKTLVGEGEHSGQQRQPRRDDHGAHSRRGTDWRRVEGKHKSHGISNKLFPAGKGGGWISRG